MKLHFSTEWLQRTIAADPEWDIEAGAPLTDFNQLLPHEAADLATIEGPKVVRLRMALGTLVRQLRLKHQMTIAELATRANVSEEELRCVEHDPHYTAKPRFLFQVSNFFDVPLNKLAQISGATHAVERGLFNNAVKYAAKSDDLSVLSAEEAQTLDAFVAYLNQQRG